MLIDRLNWRAEPPLAYGNLPPPPMSASLLLMDGWAEHATATCCYQMLRYELMPSGTHLLVTIPDDVDGKLGPFASPPIRTLSIYLTQPRIKRQSDKSKDTGLITAGAGELHSRAMGADHSEGRSGSFQTRQPVTRGI